MKAILKAAVLSPLAILMLIGDVPPQAPLRFQVVSEAHAILGIWRRHARRWAVVGTAAVATTATAAAASETAAAEQQEAAAKKQQAAAQQQAAAKPAPPPAAAPAAAAAGKALPLGTVVTALPGGCTQTPVGGVDYYYCGGTFYRAVFQGNQLVYVTAQP